MIQPMVGGHRRIDRVLLPDFVAEVENLDLEVLRERRRDSEQEEVDLSYVRRMLQGRIDIVRSEIAGRSDDRPADDDIVERLVGILGAEKRTTRGLGRHLNLEPTRVAETRRSVERIISDSYLSDVTARSDDELSAALAKLLTFEREVSDVRRRVQDVIIVFNGELTRRYRDGLVSVDSLLSGSDGDE